MKVFRVSEGICFHLGDAKDIFALALSIYLTRLWHRYTWSWGIDIYSHQIRKSLVWFIWSSWNLPSHDSPEPWYNHKDVCSPMKASSVMILDYFKWSLVYVWDLRLAIYILCRKRSVMIFYFRWDRPCKNAANIALVIALPSARCQNWESRCKPIVRSGLTWRLACQYID